jgi:outer membrane protein OmpA-like peptidoglycan-associated protein/Mg-chelatase subunit ChlD
MNMRRIILIALILGCAWASAVSGAEQADQLEISGPEHAAKLTFQEIQEGKLLVAVTDAQENPIRGLGVESFSIRQGVKTAKILSVTPLETSKEIGLNIVMVVDNSQSMRMRKAVEPLKTALEAFYKSVRPIDNIHAVVFSDRKTIPVSGRDLHAKVLQTSDVKQLRTFLSESLDDGLTDGTYLYDGIAAGLDIARRMPEKSNKFMVVFSDGEDLNSGLKRPDVRQAAQGIPNFSVYAVDYLPAQSANKFLQEFSAEHNGRSWKATSATELLPVFEAFSSTLLYRYVVDYRFAHPPTGSIAFGKPQLTIEEITTIDSAPLLNYVYFESGQSELPQRYEQFQNASETASFAEGDLSSGMHKYRHLLNIIGKRLRDNPDAAVQLIGCNADTADEKGRTDISLRRAESVRAYLHYIWQIEAQRITVDYRNLPEMPSTSRIAEGQAENRRVEIRSQHPAILDTVNSEYVQKVSDQEQLRIVPQIAAEAGLDHWKVTLQSGDHILHKFEGRGELPGELVLPLQAGLLEQITTCDHVRSTIEAVDKQANMLSVDNPEALPVNFVKRTELMSQVQGYKVKEQYALILFDYNSAAIKERNQAIVDRILARIEQIPDAAVSIVGHTDVIGSEEYNLKLSEKRAEAVQDQVIERAELLSKKMSVSGAGPHDPLYDNGLPEGRALNRTVTITLEYLEKQM